MSLNRGWALLLRGMRWRLMGSTLIVLTAAIAMGTSLIGPLYLQAGGDSLIKRAVGASPLDQRGFTLVPEPSRQVDVAILAAERRRLLDSAALRGLSEAPQTSVLSGAYLTARNGSPYQTNLVSRTGICSILHVSSGRCDLGPGDIVMSTRSAHALGVSIGTTIEVRTASGKATVPVRVTGLYRIPDTLGPYWFGAGSTYFEFGQLHANGSPPFADDLFVSAATAEGLPAAFRPTVSIQMPLRPQRVGLDNARQVVRGIGAAKRSALQAGFSFSTGLPAVIDGALHQRGLMDTIVAVAAIQLVLLAIWGLTAVLLRSADLRRSELRVARLRGFPLTTMLAVTVSEPAMLCALGMVLGVIGAWVAVRIATGILFTPGTTVTLDAWVFVGFGAAAVTICGVLGLSALRLLRGSGLGRSTPAASEAAGRTRAVTDVAILVLSAVALLAAATSGALASHSDPVAAAAPAVMALGTSVIAVRLVEFLCRRATRATVDSRRIASFLAIRQVGRRPTALRESRTLVIAVCLACFAVCAWSVARSNRATAATFSVGASRVVTVTAHGVDLQQAVDRADPRGRFAMAAVQLASQNQDVLAVQAGRLPAVASWPSGTSRVSLTRVSRALVPSTAPQVNLGPGRVSVTAAASASGAIARILPRLTLNLWVFNATEGTTIVSLGRLHPGSATYGASLSIPCTGGCRLIGVGVLSSSDQVPLGGSVRLAISALGSTSGGTSAHGGDLAAADWRSTTSGVRITRASAGVGFLINSYSVLADEGATNNATAAMASVADHPLALPEIDGSAADAVATQSGQAGTLEDEGLDGEPVAVHPVLEASALPRVGRIGEMMDLNLLARAQSGPTISGSTDEVWLNSRAPADVLARLRAAGLHITRVQSAANGIRGARHTGPALAYDFMLLATLVALLTAAVSTFGVLAAGTRQRATELVALEVAGVPRAVLTRALGVEAAILALTTLFGAAAGAGGAALAIPSLPQLGSATAAPLSYALPVLLILAVALAAVIVVVAATALAARGILRTMSPSLLRTAAYDVD